MRRGLLTKATHDYTVRFAPALVINEKDLLRSTKIIKQAFMDIGKVNRERKREDRRNRLALR